MTTPIISYLGTFVEGVLAFISPCMLPMLPIYVTYFAGGAEESTRKTLKNAVGFVVGFSLIYVALGATAGAFSSLLIRYKTITNVIFGAIVAIFGLYYAGIINIKFLSKLSGPSLRKERLENLGFGSSVLFGIIFATTSTACITVFAGSALMDASLRGSVGQGAVTMLFFSLGLGIPFIISALLINQLKGVFDFLKKHYRTINRISGVFLLMIGLSMMTGLLDKILLIVSK